MSSRVNVDLCGCSLGREPLQRALGHIKLAASPASCAGGDVHLLKCIDLYRRWRPR
jgi:hypothetical protein